MRPVVTHAAALVFGATLFTGGILTGTAIHSSASTSYRHCGTERWPVKTGSDVTAKLVNLQLPQSATVQSLRSQKPPMDPMPQAYRVQGVETTVYILDAKLVKAKQEADRDYHLVLSDGSRKTMIAEIASPSCMAKSSPFLGLDAVARLALSPYHIGRRWVRIGRWVQVEGVGFFDRVHGQAGVAPSGIELHPVISLQFIKALG